MIPTARQLDIDRYWQEQWQIMELEEFYAQHTEKDDTLEAGDAL